MAIPKDTILENSFNVTFTVPDHRFYGYTVEACPTDGLGICRNVTETFNYSADKEDNKATLSAVVGDLEAATRYNVSVWTALNNSLESVRTTNQSFSGDTTFCNKAV